MITREEWHWAAIAAVALVVATTLPYLIVTLVTPDHLVYTGFLSNPEDGSSYLAKMRQGWRGEWCLHLPFTPEPHQGEFLFTYYLLLGHVARWTRLPLMVVFHLARAVNGIVLLLVLYYVVSAFSHQVEQRRFAFLITALGSGLGWLAALLGAMTVDLWVPEGYVLYSMFVNPHFALSIALMILLIMWSVTPWRQTRLDWRKLVGLALCAAGLGMVQTFVLLPVGLVLVLYVLAQWWRRRRLPWREIASGAAIAAGGLPFVINAYLSTVTNPAFATWSAQNQTPSPPPWDYALGYGIVLLLALAGAWRAVRRRRDSDLLLLIWAASTGALLYAPFSLQRRLVMGWIVPLGVLAAIGWHEWPPRWRPRPGIVWGIASLSHVFLIAVSLAGALSGSDLHYLSTDEYAAMNWLAEQAAPEALVIAAPQTGLYIPAWAGQRVFYGHRFETAHAEQRKEQVTAFFESGDRTLLEGTLQADYVLYGPRERTINPRWQPDPAWKRAYHQGAVTIYALPVTGA